MSQLIDRKEHINLDTTFILNYVVHMCLIYTIHYNIIYNLNIMSNINS